VRVNQKHMEVCNYGNTFIDILNVITEYFRLIIYNFE